MSRPVPSSAIVTAARRYIGTPFRHQGRTYRGLDCLGLLSRAFQDVGLPVYDPADYGRQPDLARMKDGLDRQLVRVPKREGFRPGVVALFADPQWLHVGLITGYGAFIHSRGPEELGPGVVEHGLDRMAWMPRLLRMWRHPLMEW